MGSGVMDAAMGRIATEAEQLTTFNTGLTAEERMRRGGIGRIGGLETGLTPDEQAARMTTPDMPGRSDDLMRAIEANTAAVQENNARLLNAEQRIITQPTEGPF